MSIFNEHNWYLLYSPQLVVVAEGVREHHDFLGTILNQFIFEKQYINMHHVSIFDGLKLSSLNSPWLSLTRSLRVSESLLITLYHAATVLNGLVSEKQYINMRYINQFVFEKQHKTCVMSIFDEHNWYLLYSPQLSLSRSLRVFQSTMITLGPF